MRREQHLILMALLILAGTAKAVTITNLTTNTVLFHDGFENGSFSAPVGAWSSVGPDVTVTNAVPPGPAEGNFYAQLFRNSNLNNQGNVRAQLSSAQANAGDVIQLSMMLLLPDDGVAARVQLIVDDGDFNSGRAWLQSDGSGHVLAIGPGFAPTDTGLLYSPGVWQEWDLQYTIGASTFSARVNGVTASGFASFTTGPVDFADLFNGSTAAGSFYLDAVPQAATTTPEPASVLLIGSGFLGLATLRRRCLHG